MTRDQEIAGEILQQLGGERRLHVMIGAKYVFAIESGLSFRFMASRKRNHVRIILSPDDTYTVEFLNVGRHSADILSRHEGVYFDQLPSLFEAETGLVLTAPKVLQTR